MLYLPSGRMPPIKWLALAMIAGGVLFNASAAAPPGAPAPAPERTLADLAAERYQIATKGYEFCTTGHAASEAPGPETIDWMRRRVRARLDIVEPKNDRVAFVREYVELLRAQEAYEERLVQRHLDGALNLLRAQYDRLEGEILLKQVEAK